MCILRACFERSSGDLVQSSGIAFAVQDEDGGHEEVAFVRDPPPVSVLDFADEPVPVQPFEQSGDASALAAGFTGVADRREELLADTPGQSHLNRRSPRGAAGTWVRSVRDP